MNKEELQLIFVTQVGELYGNDVYEFIFSDNAEEAIGFGWELPCEYNVEPPKDTYCTHIATLNCDDKFKLSLLEEEYEKRYLDGVFGFIALGWEYIEDYQSFNTLNTAKVSFHYGETYESVIQKLATKNLSFE